MNVISILPPLATVYVQDVTIYLPVKVLWLRTTNVDIQSHTTVISVGNIINIKRI